MSLYDDLKRPELHDIHDATKMKTFMECPRKYFYQFILHWKPKTSNKHLEFGVAWHEAKEALFKGQSVEDAYATFLLHYRKHFPSIMDKDMYPKNPAIAKLALESWYELNEKFLKEIEVLHLEESGQTPLFDDHVLAWKMDVVYRDKQGVWAHDHKTASALTRAWQAGWDLDPQMKIYINALIAIYGEDNVQGAVIDGTFLQKVPKHQKVKVIHTERQMNNFFWHINYYLELLTHNMEELKKCEKEDEVLMAFPQNPQSCAKWGLCPFHSYCTAWSNPTAHVMPDDFEYSPWNPLHNDEEKENE